MADMIEEEKKSDTNIMEFPIIREEELVEVIKNMKNGKASGIDGISAKLMKEIIKDESIREYMTRCFNNVLKENIHEDWLKSITTMIPKTKRPQILDFRPIAVTVNSSKVIWTILIEKIEEHLKASNVIFENQYGFTKGGRTKHCLFTLDYIANMTYEKKK